MSKTMILHALIMNNFVADTAYFDKYQLPPWFDASQIPDGELLAFYQANIGSNLNVNCQNYIYAGFLSLALGSSYTYPADDNSQRNLAVAATVASTSQSGWARLMWCCDQNGVWDMREHNAAQIQQLNSDFDSFIQAAQLKLKNLKISLANATTSEQALALSW